MQPCCYRSLIVSMEASSLTSPYLFGSACFENLPACKPVGSMMIQSDRKQSQRNTLSLGRELGSEHTADFCESRADASAVSLFPRSRFDRVVDSHHHQCGPAL